MDNKHRSYMSLASHVSMTFYTADVWSHRLVEDGQDLCTVLSTSRRRSWVCCSFSSSSLLTSDTCFHASLRFFFCSLGERSMVLGLCPWAHRCCCSMLKFWDVIVCGTPLPPSSTGEDVRREQSSGSLQPAVEMRHFYAPLAFSLDKGHGGAIASYNTSCQAPGTPFTPATTSPSPQLSQLYNLILTIFNTGIQLGYPGTICQDKLQATKPMTFTTANRKTAHICNVSG